jgi:signal transduction histidine kinase
VRDSRTCPVVHRGRGLGVLAAFDHGADPAGFSEDDETILRAFAASGATAVALAQMVQHERLRRSLDAAEAERRRWARELHDETLQGLGGLRVILSSALRRVEHGDVAELLHEAVGQTEREIDNLRAMIAELRPAALDELGLVPAIEALVDRVSAVQGLSIECAIDLARDGPRRLGQELETTVYRLVQEALTNVAKHAHAERARVLVGVAAGSLEVEVTDDGRGFDGDTATEGFGLVGMRERVQLVGGRLAVTPSGSGTTVRAVIPLSELDEPVVQRVAH